MTVRDTLPDPSAGDEPLGAIALERGLVSKEQLAECLAEQAERARAGETLLLGQILLRRRLVDSSALAWLLQEEALRRAGIPVLPRYRIEELLGEGGMATVYRARDVELGRPVAIKFLKLRPGAENKVRERFRREGQALARLDHPNVVRVHDVGEVEGRMYLVMELVEGKRLDAWLARGSHACRAVAGLLEKIARGVEHAHRAGVVHRDLKPANVIVRDDDEPVVLDFGLAHLAGSGVDLTASGLALGTPLYMAPEQVRGLPTSPATDVHALGVLLYEHLAGRPPYAGETAAEVYARIAGEEPIPPRSIRPDVPAALETIALKAMEKDPARRYASAGEFAGDLARWLAGEPIGARPVGPLRRAARRLSRLWLLVAPVAVLAALAARPWSRPAGEPEARSAARDEAYELLESARTGLDRAATYLYRPEADPVELRRQAGGARLTIERAIELAPDLALAHHLLGRAWLLEDHPERAERAWRRATALAPSLGPAHYELGRLLATRAFLESVDEDRRAGFERARGLAAEATAEFELATADGSGLDDALDRQVARALAAYARFDFRTAGEVAHAGLATFRGRVGIEEFHWLLGITAEAGQEEPHYDRALEIRPKFPIALFCRATGRYRRGDAAGALADYDAALATAPRFQAALANRGALRLEQGDAAGAIADLSEAIAILPHDPFPWENRGRARDAAGDPAGAIADYHAALERGTPEARIATWLARAHLGRSNERYAAGDLAAALADADEAVRWAGADAAARYNRGVLRSESGDFAGALEDLDASLAASPDDPATIVNRALVLQCLERSAEALEAIDRALAVAPPDWPARKDVEAIRARIAAGNAK